MATSPAPNPPAGAQRLPLEKLHAWEALGYGMFIHYGMSTYDGDECSPGVAPPSTFAPDQLNVDQWVQVARDAGMKYAVLTAKHVAGFCLWPSKQTNYHAGNAPVKTDLIGAFVRACEQHGVLPGLYYCSWDNHHRFGSVTPRETFLGYPGGYAAPDKPAAFTTPRYREFQLAQIDELLTQYGRIAEVWIDIPGVLGHDGRRVQYEQIARLQPEALVMMNQGMNDGTRVLMDYTWPTDIMAIERYLPHSNRGYNPWHSISPDGAPDRSFYIPSEVCDPIGYEWFFKDDDRPRSDAELLGMRLICHSRRSNLLLDVPPDRHGLIPQSSITALNRLRDNFEKIVR